VFFEFNTLVTFLVLAPTARLWEGVAVVLPTASSLTALSWLTVSRLTSAVRSAGARMDAFVAPRKDQCVKLVVKGNQEKKDWIRS